MVPPLPQRGVNVYGCPGSHLEVRVGENRTLANPSILKQEITPPCPARGPEVHEPSYLQQRIEMEIWIL
jgi:hypothetical protein